MFKWAFTTNRRLVELLVLLQACVLGAALPGFFHQPDLAAATGQSFREMESNEIQLHFQAPEPKDMMGKATREDVTTIASTFVRRMMLVSGKTDKDLVMITFVILLSMLLLIWLLGRVLKSLPQRKSAWARPRQSGVTDSPWAEFTNGCRTGFAEFSSGNRSKKGQEAGVHQADAHKPDGNNDKVKFSLPPTPKVVVHYQRS